jgi:hypothetical protein
MAGCPAGHSGTSSTGCGLAVRVNAEDLAYAEEMDPYVLAER